MNSIQGAAKSSPLEFLLTSQKQLKILTFLNKFIVHFHLRFQVK